jgi:signal transduction histidine kinase
MSSLRRQMLGWLLPLFAIAAILAAVCAYITFGDMVRFFMDSQLRVIADSHADASGPIAALRPLTAHNVDKGDLIVQIWDRDNRLATSSWPTLQLPRQETAGFHDVTVGNGSWRVYTVQSPDRTVQSAQSLEFREQVVREHAQSTATPIVLLIPVSAIMLWLVLHFALRRLELVAQAAARQNEHSFGDLPVEHAPDEIRPLVDAVNTLLGRLREAFAAQRRFVQDAAHELRTPITAMSLQLENFKNSCSDVRLNEELVHFEKGLARTKRLVEQLLRLARQETPRTPAPPTTIALDELLRSMIGDFMPFADRRCIDLGCAADIGATVTANKDELRSLLHNLLDNALRYTPQGGVVDVTLHNDTGVVTVEIVDSGPGIANDLLPRVFDRFYRIEGSDSEGSGLGLAIAKNAAEHNRVGLELNNRVDCSGLIARVRFLTAVIVPRQPQPVQHSVAVENTSSPTEVSL